MFDLQPVLEFSRNNCVAICSFLVPANLIITSLTLALVSTNQALITIRWSMAIASIMAISLFLHVSTWFIIGVITPVTFILFGLGTTCLLTNALAMIYRQQIIQFVAANR